MSNLLTELFVDIKADTSKLASGISAVKGMVGGLGSSITAALGPVAAAFAGAFAVKEMVSAFMEGELAMAELTSTLASNGQEVEGNVAKLKELAAAIQAATRVGDEETFALISKGLNLGLPAAEMETFAKSAIGLGAALKMGPEEAMAALAKEAQGVKSNLDRSIPALKGVEDQQQRLAIISQFAAKGLEQEQAATQTLSGQMTQLWNAVGDLAETLGGFLAPIIGFGVELLKELTAILQDTADAFTGMEVDTASLGEYLRGVLLQNITLIATALQAIAPVVIEVVGTVLGWFNKMADFYLDLTNKMWTYGVRIPEMWQQWGDATSSTFGAIGEWFSWLGNEIDSFVNWSIDSIGSFVEDFVFAMMNIDLVVQEAGIALADFGAAIKDNFNWYVSIVTTFGSWLYENWSDIWLTVLDQSLTAVINWGDNLKSILSEAWDYIKSGGKDAFEPAIKALDEGAKEFNKPFELPAFKDSFDADAARANLDEIWAERRKEWDAITREDPLETAMQVGDIPIIKQAAEDKKKGSKSSDVGTFQGLGEAFKKANSAAMKAEEKRREEALKTQKQQLDEQKKTNQLLENMQVGLA